MVLKRKRPTSKVRGRRSGEAAEGTGKRSLPAVPLDRRVGRGNGRRLPSCKKPRRCPLGGRPERCLVGDGETLGRAATVGKTASPSGRLAKRRAAKEKNWESKDADHSAKA